ncbi:AAA family ATPase [Stenotrophomonas sp.]|uniref:AAA family ATPase n=1 Tax=Stenotrophomonas sp. TaxID=69392 RepID=UPI0028B05543|nr:AAA family ATPase [Stenotrophomonas sp.]
MIYVDRSRYPAPAELLDFQQKSLATLREFFATGIDDRRLRWPSFNFPPRVGSAVRDTLYGVFNGSCAYCGAPANTIDHFRPRRNAVRAGHKVDTDCYWWLSAEWNNLYLCCAACNVAKANFFPIDGPVAEPETFGDALLDERPVLLDPCHDRPEEHLKFLADGTVAGLTARGTATIEILQLNARDRLASRRNIGFLIREELRVLQAQGRDSMDPLGYLAARLDAETAVRNRPEVAAAIQALVEEISGQQASPPPPPAAHADADADADPVPGLAEMAWLDRIEISNFRSISTLDLAFQSIVEGGEGFEDTAGNGQPWIMLLGENGVGKTSVLQAVALACMPDDQLNELGPAHRWLNRNADVHDGFIRLSFSDGTQRLLTFSRDSIQFSSEGVASPVRLLGYGSTRLLPERNSTPPAAPARCSVRNLFDQRHPLANAEAYFCTEASTRSDNFELIASSVEKLLPDQGDAKLTRSDDGMWRNQLPLDALSGGYKSMIALAMDIMFHLSGSSFDMESARGMILLDEIELHLHPRWKIRVVSQLRALFPNVRFIVSTHDPLCVQGLGKGELIVLATNPYSGTFIHEEIDVPPGAGTDKVLMGPWFGMTSTLDPDTLRQMDRHSELLKAASLDVMEQKELDSLMRTLCARMNTFHAHSVPHFAIEGGGFGAGLWKDVPQPLNDGSEKIIHHRLLGFLDKSTGSKEGGHA